MSATPFTDPALVHGALYATPDRLTRRTGALHAAKIVGSDAAALIASLCAEAAPGAAVILDLGCGRGTTVLHLAARLSEARVIALDHSPALLTTTRARLAEAGQPVQAVCADFHRLPLPEAAVDVAVAAFCVYHSPHPERVLAEMARCLRPGGTAILATKSADSYYELDQLVVEVGLDPEAASRPSLYATFHSGNLERIAAAALRVESVLHERHVFRFDGPDHVAAYLVTSPKYRLPRHLIEVPGRLAAELRRRTGERTVTATSTVTYAVAVRP